MILALSLVVGAVPGPAHAAQPLSNPYCASSGAAANDTCYGTGALASENGGYANSAFGVAALAVNSTGTENTATGYGALSNSNGNNNTADGFTALSGNTTGYNNTADGYEAMRYETTGHENVADGSQALYNNDSGYYDTAVGTNSLISNTSGHDDTAIGDTALYSNSTGIDNTVLGSYAGANGGDGNTTGSNNTFLGYSAGAASPTQLSNATAIGANATVGESNALVLGGTGSNAVNVGIGTITPGYPLSVAGVIQSSTGGFMFPDGSTQTSAGIAVAPGVTGTYVRSNGSAWQASAIPASDVPAGSSYYIQNTNDPQPGANFNVGGNGAIGGTLNAGNAGIGIAGSPNSLLQVGVASTSYGSYVQLPVVTNNAAPPASDCNTTNLVGRVVVQISTGSKAKTTVWACATTGKWTPDK